MATQQLALPIAVVVAGIIVAAAVMFSRPSPLPVLTPPATGPIPPPAAPPTVIDTPAVRARAAENARLALEAHRPEFVQTCWNPSAAQRAEPRQIPLVFNLSFTAQGELNGLGIHEDHERNRADVGNCLRTLVIALKIAAPGVPLTLDVPMTLP